jgi:hypothetical protein
MSTTLQFRRYNTANLATITGSIGELIVNTDNNSLTVQDGSTPGGWPLATQSNVNLVAAGGVNLSSFTGNIIPSASNTYTLGTAGNTFKSLSLGSTGLSVGGTTISGSSTLSIVNSGSNVTVYSGTISVLTSGNGIVVSSGNVTIAPGNGDNWNFLSNASVIFPNGRVQATAYPGVVNSVPSHSTGASGDQKGMIASDGNYLYICYNDYTSGSNNIWAKVATVGQSW